MKRNISTVWMVLGVFCVIVPVAMAEQTILYGDVITVGVDESGGLINSLDGFGIDIGNTPGGRDFLLPGDPWEGYSIGINGKPGSWGYLRGPMDIAGFDWGNNFNAVTTTDTSSGSVLSTITNATGSEFVPGLALVQTLSFSKGASIIDFRIELINTTGTDMENVIYARFLDPDQDAYEGGLDPFNTKNTIISEDLVTATGVASGWTIGIYSDSEYTHNASINTWAVDPYELWAWGTPTAPFWMQDGGNGDYSIAMAWNIGTLKGGESAFIDFQYRVGMQTIPVPGALVLCSMGLGLTALLRKRRTL